MDNIEKENTTYAAGNVELNKEDHPPAHKKATIEGCFESPMENIEKENTTYAAGNVKLNKVPWVRSVFVFSVCIVLLNVLRELLSFSECSEK